MGKTVVNYDEYPPLWDTVNKEMCWNPTNLLVSPTETLTDFAKQLDTDRSFCPPLKLLPKCLEEAVIRHPTTKQIMTFHSDYIGFAYLRGSSLVTYFVHDIHRKYPNGNPVLFVRIPSMRGERAFKESYTAAYKFSLFRSNNKHILPDMRSRAFLYDIVPDSLFREMREKKQRLDTKRISEKYVVDEETGANKSQPKNRTITLAEIEQNVDDVVFTTGVAIVRPPMVPSVVKTAENKPKRLRKKKVEMQMLRMAAQQAGISFNTYMKRYEAVNKNAHNDGIEEYEDEVLEDEEQNVQNQYEIHALAESMGRTMYIDPNRASSTKPQEMTTQQPSFVPIEQEPEVCNQRQDVVEQVVVKPAKVDLDMFVPGTITKYDPAEYYNYVEYVKKKNLAMVTESTNPSYGVAGVSENVMEDTSVSENVMEDTGISETDVAVQNEGDVAGENDAQSQQMDTEIEYQVNADEEPAVEETEQQQVAVKEQSVEETEQPFEESEQPFEESEQSVEETEQPFEETEQQVETIEENGAEATIVDEVEEMDCDIEPVTEEYDAMEQTGDTAVVETDGFDLLPIAAFFLGTKLETSAGTRKRSEYIFPVPEIPDSAVLIASHEVNKSVGRPTVIQRAVRFQPNVASASTEQNGAATEPAHTENKKAIVVHDEPVNGGTITKRTFDQMKGHPSFGIVHNNPGDLRDGGRVTKRMSFGPVDVPPINSYTDVVTLVREISAPDSDIHKRLWTFVGKATENGAATRSNLAFVGAINTHTADVVTAVLRHISKGVK